MQLQWPIFVSVGLFALTTGCPDTRRLGIIGDPCVETDECQSGLCDEQVCKSLIPASRGASCDHDLECGSEVCEQTPAGGKCGPAIRKTGENCTRDPQCETGACLAGGCASEAAARGDFIACAPAPVAVAVSSDGFIGYSTDQGDWRPSPSNGTWTNLRSVAAGLGRFVVVGDDEAMAYSDDGNTWSEVADPYPDGNMSFTVVIHAGQGEWAAAGADAAGSRVIVSYDHGTTWQDAGSPFGPTTSVTGIAVHRDTGRWVAVGAPGDLIAIATRPTTKKLGEWTQLSTMAGASPAAGAGLSAVAHHAGGWTAVGPQGNAVYSLDGGEAWSYIAPLCGGEDLGALVVGGGQVLALGRAGCVARSTSGADGEWTVSSVAPPLAEGVSLSGGYHDCGLERYRLATGQGDVAYLDAGGALWQAEPTSLAFSAGSSLVGVAADAPGAVRAQVWYSYMSPPWCGDSVPGGTPRDLYLVDMHLPSDESSHQRRVGMKSGNNHYIRLRAGLRITTAGTYSFEVVRGASDHARVFINGEEALPCDKGADIDLSPGVAAMDVRYNDDGWSDALAVRYKGPDTGGEMRVIPASAFVRLY